MIHVTYHSYYLVQSITHYCATIDQDETGGNSGYIALQVNNGQAIYSISVDMSNIDSNLCVPVTDVISLSYISI